MRPRRRGGATLGARVRAGGRQHEAHMRALAGGAADADVAAGLAHESVHHRQAEAAAAAEGLGGEEGLEHALQHRRLDALAGVADVDLHVVARRHLDHAGERGVELAQRNGDRQLAAFGHGVAGVDREVEDGVLELVRVDQGVQRRAGQAQVDADRLAQRAREQVRHVVDQRTDLHRGRRERLPAREGEEPPDQLGTAPRRLQRRIDELRARTAAHALLQRGQVADDDGEQVVEVMREPAGELAHGLHLLRLHQRGLARLLFGDVDRHHEEADRRAFAIEFGDDHAARMDDAAVGALACVFVADLLARAGAVEMRADLFEGLETEHINEVAPGDRVLGEPEPLRVALVGEAVDVVAVDIGDQRRDRVDDQLQAVLAAPQRAGDVVDLDVGLGEAGVCGLELGRALAHPRLELCVLLFDDLGVAALFGDVGPQRDESEVGDRHAAHRQDAAVGAGALDVVRLEAARGGDALAHQGLDIARAVFAAFGVEAREILERGADAHHGLGEIEQAQHRLVPGHQLGRGVEHRDRLVEQIQPGEQQVVAPALLRRQGGIGEAFLFGFRHGRPSPS